jgi:hypothetical protein
MYKYLVFIITASFSTNSCSGQNQRPLLNDITRICIGFEPDSFKSESPFNLTNKLSVNEASIINKSVKDNKDSAERLLVLVLLKVYRSHLYCCNQPYAIGNVNEKDSISNPILYNFYKISGFPMDKELALSSHIYQWVLKKEYANWPPIKAEIAKIKVRLDKIEKGDF